MKKCVLAVLLAASGMMAVPSFGQTPKEGIDRHLLDAGKTVTPQQLKSDDETLVAFGTRNIFSEDQGPKRGLPRPATGSPHSFARSPANRPGG
jgi:hypothetical protein